MISLKSSDLWFMISWRDGGGGEESFGDFEDGLSWRAFDVIVGVNGLFETFFTFKTFNGIVRDDFVGVYV